MNGGQSLLKLAVFASRAVQHPSWAVAHVGNITDRLYDRIQGEPWGGKSWQATGTISAVDALEKVGGWPSSEVAKVIDELRMPEHPQSSIYPHNPDGSRDLLFLAYAWCRLARPALVIETGVANGFSTSAILQALEHNGEGRLVSIDLPHLHPRALATIGSAVEPELRLHWRLCLGGAASTMARMLSHTADGVDFFLQDASHCSRGQMAEYRAAWPHLNHGAILLSDDVTDTFDAFASEVDRAPVYVRQPKWRPIGLLRK